MIGSQVHGNKEAAQAIFAAGHELGNHSDSYSSLGNSTVEVITASLDAASLAIKDITGTYPLFFRAPNLNHGRNLSMVCVERGMAIIDGSGHNDWPGSSQEIKNSVLANPQDGDIIILHENNTSKGNTMAALPGIIKGLRDKGFWILTVGQLAAVKEKTFRAGMHYGPIH